VVVEAIRERETAVAIEMTNLLVANVRSTTVVPQEVLAHFFGLACQKLDFIPDEISAQRILHSVRGEIGLRQRAADRLNDFLITSTEELLEAQREAQQRAKRGR
jgi:hypothetical protein